MRVVIGPHRLSRSTVGERAPGIPSTANRRGQYNCVHGRVPGDIGSRPCCAEGETDQPSEMAATDAIKRIPLLL
jgi:hypothetical protein